MGIELFALVMYRPLWLYLLLYAVILLAELPAVEDFSIELLPPVFL